jgi:phosphate transport system permease protein
MGLIMIILVLGILLTLIVQSMPSIKSLGLKYLWGKVWDPVQDIYGAWPFLLGTLLSSFLALIISIPFHLAVAIFLGEYHPKGWMPDFLKEYGRAHRCRSFRHLWLLGTGRTGADRSQPGIPYRR